MLSLTLQHKMHLFIWKYYNQKEILLLEILNIDQIKKSN